MSWRDRPYSGDDSDRPELRIRFRRPGSAVGWLIIANAVIFVLQVLTNRSPIDLTGLLGLSLDGVRSLHVWQPFTYMFMHAGVLHLVVNMLMLYICGTEFERTFGHERFLQFYGTCGLIGGIAYLLLGVISERYASIPLVGASGAIYGLLMAAIVLFPHIQVVLFIFPMPIRIFGLIMLAILLLQVLGGNVQNAGGEVCHVAGALSGLGMFYAWGIMPRVRVDLGFLGRGGGRRTRTGAWARRQQQLRDEQEEVDRILAKVHREGLQSLTRSEKRVLSRATQRQRERDRELDRAHRL